MRAWSTTSTRRSRLHFVAASPTICTRLPPRSSSATTSGYGECSAYFREALGTGSPFFKFLAYWNALSVACVDLDGELKPWLVATMEKHPNLRGDNKPPPPDWWEYLFWEQRGAVAHAVRGEKYPPEMDPDDPETQSRFDVDARLLQDLVRIRVRERWGDHAVYGRPRPEHFDGPAD